MENYERLEEIGKGSYGSVYKIKRKSDEQILVWKELDYRRMNEREKSQVAKEVNILSQLNHPNIVKYYDKIVDKESKRIYIIMEYCQNGDMSQLIKKCKVDKDFIAEDVVWKIFVQILLALKECHNRKDGKILHRDLKPGNVFLDVQNNVKLGDFGLSRILTQESEYAHTNVGTPYYMSPEQINEAQYNEKTDIWSAGCILYEIISLRPPFDASNHLALAKKIITGQIERIPERYSEDLQNIIQLMLSTDPEKRPSVDQLSEIPKIQLRISEREIREQYTKLKEQDAEISNRMERAKKKEEELKQREDALKVREQKAIEMKLRLSAAQGPSLKFSDLYKSTENQKLFGKILEEGSKENASINQAYYQKQGKQYQTNSQSSVTELLKRARQGSNSNHRTNELQNSQALCELNDHNLSKRVDSSSRLFGDVSIASSIDVSSQMLGTGKKLTLMQFSSTSDSATPTSKQTKASNINESGITIMTSQEFQKVPLFSLKNSQQKEGSLNRTHLSKRDDSQNSNGQQESESYYKLSQGDNYQKPPNSNGSRSTLLKKNQKIQQNASNIFQQINQQIQAGCPPRVSSAVPKGYSSQRQSQNQVPTLNNTGSQKQSSAQLQIPNNLAEKLALKDMEQQTGRQGLQRRPSSSNCGSLTRVQSSAQNISTSLQMKNQQSINNFNTGLAPSQTQINFYSANNSNGFPNSNSQMMKTYHHTQSNSMSSNALSLAK